MTPLEELEKLARREHHFCEDDDYFTCPKVYDPRNEWECDCGADEHNAKVDEVMERINSK